MKGQRVVEASKAIFILCICSDHWLWATYCAGDDTKKKKKKTCTVPTPKVNKRNMSSNGEGGMSVLFLPQHHMHQILRRAPQ